MDRSLEHQKPYAGFLIFDVPHRCSSQQRAQNIGIEFRSTFLSYISAKAD